MERRPPAARSVLRALLAVELAVIVLAVAIVVSGRPGLALGVAIVPLAVLGAAHLGVARGSGP